ncbi:MAG: ABC transporter permease [Chloroflexota bacterium]|nr:ABC transporter permease [Chloroflexota bacterium]
MTTFARSLESDRFLVYLQRYGAIVALLLTLGVAALLAPELYQPGNLSNVMRQAAMLGIVAIGQTLVLLTAGIDLSVGAVIGLAAIVIAEYTGGQDALLWSGVALTLTLGALVGLANGWLVTKRNVPPFIATLGMLVFVEGARFAYTRGVPSGTLPAALRYLGTGQLGPFPVSFIMWIVLSLIGILLLRRTPYGWQLYATGGNWLAARLSGVNVDRIVASTYVISALLASLTGLILSGYIGYIDRYIGTGFDLDSIAAAVVGGTSFVGGKGGLGGTIAGVLFMSFLLNLILILNLAVEWQLVVKGAVIVGAVALYQSAERA